jgi:hypothetical protein
MSTAEIPQDNLSVAVAVIEIAEGDEIVLGAGFDADGPFVDIDVRLDDGLTGLFRLRKEHVYELMDNLHRSINFGEIKSREN